MQQETVEKVEHFTDKYLWKMPRFTIAEYAILAVVCLFIARRFS